MGIPKGVTLIVGGGFHGKSTLLNALELGVYQHIPGDGRELCATLSHAVKIRAEDGRSVEKVDISPFINNLPFGKKTTRFSTDNASGSTSQAANIMEALEMGAGVLLIDEDTSATNFMIRDERMQALVVKEKEPITPFIQRVRQYYEEQDVSTILVMGGSGDYFDVADTVIMMDQYLPEDVTSRAKEIVQIYPPKGTKEKGEVFEAPSSRKPMKKCFNPSRGRRDVKIQSRGLHTILYGETTIDLSFLEQLICPSQTRAIAWAIHHYSCRILGVKHSDFKEGLEILMETLEKEGLDLLSSAKSWDTAMPRIFEVAGAINRMRGLRVED